MECSAELSLDAEEIAEQVLELGHKNRSVVTNDGVREAIMSYYHVNNYFC